MVSKTRKAFVGPRKGRDVEYNGARVRPSCANDTVSLGLSRCRIVPANSFMPPPPLPPPPSFSPHCAVYVCVCVCLCFCVRARTLLVSLHVTSTYAADPGIIAVPRLSERIVNDTAGVDKIYYECLLEFRFSSDRL